MSTTETANTAKMSAGNIYLLFYNIFQTLGWLILLIQTVHHLIFEDFTEGLWENTNQVLKIYQTLAILEILHSAFGLVSSSAVVTTVQIFSRVFILWCICHSIPETRISTGLPLLLIAWSVTEVIRYSFYFMALLKQFPYFLSYLRYTLFIVLYPLGVTGEMLCCWCALSVVAQRSLFSVTMPNLVNFSFDFYYALIFIMLMYIPVFPQLYLHMFAQRKKVLSMDKKKE